MSSVNAKMESLDMNFEQWIVQLERICSMAVYRNEKSLMELLLRNLNQKMDEIEKVRKPLEWHLQKAKKPMVIDSPHKLYITNPVMKPVFQDSVPNIPRIAAVLHGMPDLPNQPKPDPAFLKPAEKAVLNNVTGSLNGNEKPAQQEDISDEDNSSWSKVVRKGKGKENKAHKNGQMESKSGGEEKIVNVTQSDSMSTGSEEVDSLEKKKVFITNLNRETDPKKIASFMVEYGSVVDVFIFRTADGISCGYATVEFVTELSVQHAIEVGHITIDGWIVQIRPCFNRETVVGNKRFHLFLPGVPTFLSDDDVKAAVERKAKVRCLKFNPERGYALVELENPRDMDRIIADGTIKIGEKIVEVKKNNLRK